MPQHAQLAAQPRELLGKKVRRLRREGILPATVYGHNVKPQSIQLVAHELASVLRHSGRSQLIDLVIGDSRARPVFIKQTAVDAKRNLIVHVEFYQANLLERMTTHLPLHLVGESQAVKDGGIMLVVLDHVDIECLPDDVPAGGVEVDLAAITEINGAIHAGDVTLPPGVTLLTPIDEALVKVDPPAAEEVVAEAVSDTLPLPNELGGDQTPPDAVPHS